MISRKCIQNLEGSVRFRILKIKNKTEIPKIHFDFSSKVIIAEQNNLRKGLFEEIVAIKEDLHPAN